MNISPHTGHISAAELPAERLAGNTSLTEPEKIAEASRQFEAILLRQILEAAQKPVIQSKLQDDSTAGSIYRDLLTNQLADSISKSGSFGLAKTFQQQLDRQAGHTNSVRAPSEHFRGPCSAPESHTS